MRTRHGYRSTRIGLAAGLALVLSLPALLGCKEKRYRCLPGVHDWVATCEHDASLQFRAAWCDDRLFIVEVDGVRPDVPIRVEVSPADAEGVEQVVRGVGIQLARPPEYRVTPTEAERQLLLPLFAACLEKSQPPMDRLSVPESDER